MFAGQILAQEVTLSVPTAILPGTEVEVIWQGPDAPGDFVVIAYPDALAATYVTYARTSKGNPAVLIAPEAGEYEVRYISASGLSVLAKVPLSVSAATTAHEITAPSEAEAGTEISVVVSDSGEAIDYVTIVTAGAPDNALGPYARLRGASAVSLAVPDTPGDHEIRHIQASSQTILARASLTITAPVMPVEAVSEDESAPSSDGGSGQTETTMQPANEVPASLLALVAVDRLTEFGIAWSGPGNTGDRIEVRADSQDAQIVANQPVTAGSPLRMMSPGTPGSYEIVYVDSASGTVLARRELEVR